MYEAGGKRALDVIGAAVLLVVLLPVFLSVAALVRLRLGAPVLFMQPRAGRGGRPFTLPKFRSMRIGPGSDAERLDGFGRALRRSGLDELPQLLTVLLGEMSLVGPRPLPLDYVPRYSPRQAVMLRVRPGLAGPGIAAGRNAVGWADRLELAAAYAEHVTLANDGRIVLGSLRVWISGRGATAPGHATMPSFRGADERPG